MRKSIMSSLSALCVMASLLAGYGGSCTKQPVVPMTVQTESTVSADGTPTSDDVQKILIAYFAVAENSDVDAVSSASVLPDTDKGYSRYIAEIIA